MFLRDLNEPNLIARNNLILTERIDKINKINFNFFIISIIILYLITLHGIFFLVSEPSIRFGKKIEIEENKRIIGK
jgi:hypothetical protein